MTGLQKKQVEMCRENRMTFAEIADQGVLKQDHTDFRDRRQEPMQRHKKDFPLNQRVIQREVLLFCFILVKITSHQHPPNA